ncbi:MAG: sulfite exporter TauE/SafE family protein, partial [Solirubrobacterales bacterium]|nr:sulfite exporter TauE/SafE family protein [Solirubrobacterales bacterium]
MTVLAVFAGGLLQGTAGFGFALLAAPLLVALLGPQEAVGALVVLGAVVNA